MRNLCFRIEEERFKQAQLDVKPENAEHKAFRELEEMLKSGKLFPTDQVNPKRLIGSLFKVTNKKSNCWSII